MDDNLNISHTYANTQCLPIPKKIYQRLFFFFLQKELLFSNFYQQTIMLQFSKRHFPYKRQVYFKDKKKKNLLFFYSNQTLKIPKRNIHKSNKHSLSFRFFSQSNKNYLFYQTLLLLSLMLNNLNPKTKSILAYNTAHFFYIPCIFRMQIVIALHNFLAFITLNDLFTTTFCLWVIVFPLFFSYLSSRVCSVSIVSLTFIFPYEY